MGGSLFRGSVTALCSLGLFDVIRPLLPEDTRALLDAPPASPWIPRRHCDRIFQAVSDVRGPAGVRALVLTMSRETVGPILLPVIKTVFAVMSPSPVSFFRRLDVITRPQFKGSTFKYEAAGAKEGFVSVTQDCVVDALGWFAWDCAFEFMFELCRVSGTVHGMPAVDGKSCRFWVHWT